jgi:hypothetical protein
MQEQFCLWRLSVCVIHSVCLSKFSSSGCQFVFIPMANEFVWTACELINCLVNLAQAVSERLECWAWIHWDHTINTVYVCVCVCVGERGGHVREALSCQDYKVTQRERHQTPRRWLLVSNGSGHQGNFNRSRPLKNSVNKRHTKTNRGVQENTVLQGSAGECRGMWASGTVDYTRRCNLFLNQTLGFWRKDFFF